MIFKRQCDAEFGGLRKRLNDKSRDDIRFPCQKVGKLECNMNDLRNDMKNKNA